MATFAFKSPDGTTIHADGANEAEALNNAKVMWTRITGPAGASQDKGRNRFDQADYLKTLAKERVANAQGPLSGSGRIPSFIGGAVGAVTKPIYGAAKVLQNEWDNADRRKRGEAPVSSGAVWDATRDATNEDIHRQVSNHPVTAAIGTGVGLLGGPEAMAIEQAGNLGMRGLGLGVDLAAKAPVVGTGAAKTASALKAFSKAAPTLSRYVGGTAKAVGAGAGTGALLGFGEGSTMDERIANAIHEGAGGALTGGLLHGLGAPAVGVAKPLLQDAGRGVMAKVAPTWGAAKRAAADTEAARRQALESLAQGGLTPENFAERTARGLNMGETLAEAGGPASTNLLAATARRGGATGGKLDTQLAARAQAAPEDILGDIHKHLGIDPKTAQGSIDDLVGESETRADALWKHAYEQGEGGVWSPEIHRLMGTSFGARMLNEAEGAAEATGRVHEAPQYAEVEVPPAGQSTNPETDDAIGAAPAGVDLNINKRGAPPPSRGLSMSQYMAKRGGINNQGVESITAAHPDLAVSLKFHGKVAHPNGLLSDQGALDAAVNAGYYPNGAPSMDHFIEDLKADTAATRAPHLNIGVQRFSREAPADDMFARQRQAMEEAKARGQYEEAPPSEDDYGNVGEPEYEPTTQLVPTGRTLDRARRRANAMVKRDKFTGKPDPNFSTENEVPLKWGSDLTEALAGKQAEFPGDSTQGAWPGLRAALDESSDNLGMKSAQNRVKGTVFGNSSLPDFNRVWDSLRSGGEKLAGQVQIANDAMNLFGRGRLAGRSFATPDIKLKFQKAFPDQDVDSFVADMAKRADLAKSGGRMAPGSGSQTAPLMAAGEETDAAALKPEDVAHAILQAGSGNPGHAIVGLLKKASAYPRTAGSGVAQRDALGDILRMKTNDPEALAFLRGDTAPPPATPGLLDGLGINEDWAKRLGVFGGALNSTAQ